MSYVEPKLPDRGPYVVITNRAAISGNLDTAAHWLAVYQSLSLTGMTQSMAAHLCLVSDQGNLWVFQLGSEAFTMLTAGMRERIADAISRHVGRQVAIAIMLEDPSYPTPAQIAADMAKGDVTP